MEITEEEKLKELKEVIKILNDFNIEFFIFCGAVLFAYRDGKFHPRNFGLAIYKDEKYKDKYFSQIRERLKEIGYKDKSFGSVISVKKEYDFMIYFLGWEYGNWFSRSPFGLYAYIPETFHKFEKIKFYDLELNVPYPVRDYLKWCYGKKWEDKNQVNHCYPPAKA